MSNLDHARFKEKEVSGACGKQDIPVDPWLLKVPRFAGSMSAELAEYITAIVGLREAIVSEYRLVRYIWTVLFVVGLGATAYYLSDTVAEFIACPTSTSVSTTFVMPQLSAALSYLLGVFEKRIRL